MRKIQILIAAMLIAGCSEHVDHGIIARKVNYVSGRNIYYRFILADTTGKEVGEMDVDIETYIKYHVGDTIKITPPTNDKK